MTTHFLLMLFAAALTISLAGFPSLIKRLKQARVGQYIQDDGPKHLDKSQTPTCAGVFVVMTSVTLLALCGLWVVQEVALVALIMVVFMAIGLRDDLSKLYSQNNNLGLSARTKALLQAFAAVVALIGLSSLMGERLTQIIIPYGAGHVWTFDLGWLYYPFGFMVIVGASNAFNLTDGLDGLFAGLTCIVCCGFLVFFFNDVHLISAPEIMAVPAVLIGSLLGFMWYNAYPASVFLGDSGSLSIGAALACISILSKTELLFGILSGVFVMETLSVIIQVAYYKTTGGKRFFKMAPIHHHFELSGMKEAKIVVRFWMLGLIFLAISVCFVLR